MDWVMLAGWIGPIVGVGTFLLGGAIHMYFAVKGTKGRPRKRAVAIKMCVFVWVLVIMFTAGVLLIPPWYNLLVAIPFVVCLGFAARWYNSAHLRIPKEESGPDA